MRSVIAAMMVAIGAGAVGACASSGPSPSATQRQALETRTLDAGRTDVLNAAATAMMDEGILFQHADADAGLLRGGGITIWVREMGARKSEVRVQFQYPAYTADGHVLDTSRVVAAIERRLPGGAAGPITTGGRP